MTAFALFNSDLNPAKALSPYGRPVEKQVDVQFVQLYSVHTVNTVFVHFVQYQKLLHSRMFLN